MDYLHEVYTDHAVFKAVVAARQQFIREGSSTATVGSMQSELKQHHLVEPMLLLGV